MTEESDDGKNLVGVRAQVMMRDDGTGLWVPMGGGGLSNVTVRKRKIQHDLHDHKQEYLIYGTRPDQTVVLSCTIKKDFEYNKVMPTFHHWRTGDHKFGLTFQTAADARLFDQGVRLAVDDLSDGECGWRGGHQPPQQNQPQQPQQGLGGPTWVGHQLRHPRYSSRQLTARQPMLQCIEGLTDFPSFRYGYSTDVEDDVFMTINLPVERDGSRSSSGSVTTSSSSRHTPTTTPLPTPPDHPLHTNIGTPLDTHHGIGGGGGGAFLGGVSSTSTTTSPSNAAGTIVGGLTPAQTYSSSPTSTHSHANHHRITYMPRSLKGRGVIPPQNKDKTQYYKGLDSDLESKPFGGHPNLSSPVLDTDEKGYEKGGGGETYSYVEFVERPHMNEYHYPVIEGRRDSITSIKKETQAPQVPPMLPPNKQRKSLKNRRGRKSKCRHCHDSFTDEGNTRGSCEYAPDCVRTVIQAVTCIGCAQCMLYHCMSDAEGDFPHHPCDCSGVGGIPAPDESCGKRWLGLALLSLIVPCLWCYPPLRACHKCAVGCGICGGRHQASS